MGENNLGEEEEKRGRKEGGMDEGRGKEERCCSGECYDEGRGKGERGKGGGCGEVLVSREKGMRE